MTNSAISDQPRAVLLVGSDPADATVTRRALDQVVGARYRVRHAAHLSAAIECVRRGGIDVVLVDLSLPDVTGREAFRALRIAAPGVPIVIVAGHDEEQLALGLVREGAQDYVLKEDIDSKLLVRSLRYALEYRRATVLEGLNRDLEQTKSSLTRTVARLKAANDNLAQFTCLASHDLQEPIRKITHLAAALRYDLGDHLNAEASEDLYYIADGARRMQALVESFLSLSKAGDANLKWGPVELESCVCAALECLSPQIEASGARIVRGTLPVVKGDAILLTQLYQNLISNALKFTGGSPPVIELTALRKGSQWTLGVRDNGIGIDPLFAHKIFAPFQRLHGRSRYEGTGLGLAICKKVIDRHVGRIWVESNPGAGAWFKFVLSGMSEPRSVEFVPAPTLAGAFETVTIPLPLPPRV